MLLQRSFCGQDSDCPTFGRTRCVGPSLGFCLTGKVEYYTIPGKCVRRGNITCRLKVLLEMGDQAQCDYYTCAQCRHPIDCTGLNQVTTTTTTTTTSEQQQLIFISLDVCRLQVYSERRPSVLTVLRSFNMMSVFVVSCELYKTTL